MIIGITGTDGAGKGTVVDYLIEKKGFIHCSARALWIDEIKKRGLEVKRENMRIVANELRASEGDDFLITEYKRRTHFDPQKNYIIDSVRTIAEVATLKTNEGVLWAVDADQHIRYSRIQSRGSETDKASFEEFVSQEALEMNDPNPHGMQKAKVMTMANITLTNNGTPEELYAQVEEALKNFK
jgi:dephospho-CoA kinase